MTLRPWLASVVMLLVAAVVHAAQPAIVFAPRRALKAGETVTVGWEGLPADADEHEFLLVTDDGETIRLTHQLMPANGSFDWTVPNLPSRAAVLQLRAGFDGEEIVLASSEPFEIEGGDGRPTVEFRHGEWWAFQEGAPSSAPPAFRTVTRAAIPTAFMRPREWLLRAGTDLSDARCLDAPEVTSSRVDTRCGAPLVVPQRK